MPLYVALDRLFGFDLDVCAKDKTAAKCAEYFTPEEDALAQTWAPSVCWMNPPYSNLAPWLEKAWREAQDGAVVVALVPPRLDTGYWHEWANRADRRIELQGRVQFWWEGEPVKGKGKSNQHPSTILIYDPAGRFSRVQVGVPAPPVFSWEWRPVVQEIKEAWEGLPAWCWRGSVQGRRCSECNTPLRVGSRADAVFCSTRCRVAVHRAKRNGKAGGGNG